METKDGNAPGSVHRPLLAQTKDKYRALGENDMRVVATDVTSIAALEERYGKQLSVADERMIAKKETMSNAVSQKINYDYDNDWRFQMWSKDQAILREKLKIHWIDDLLDRPSNLLTYFLRVGTTVGLACGIGRSTYLYRTMDRAYAKLHGVSFGNIMVFETSVAVLKGACCALSGLVGATVGESCAKLANVVRSGDIAAPQRHWSHITSAFVFASLFSGGALSGFYYNVLSPRGIVLTTGVSTLIGSGVGWYLGYIIYRPFAETRQHRIDVPHWRPWQERQLTRDGPRHVRGRYM